MVYFRVDESSSGSGTGAILTVNYSDDFIGVTLTATNGTTTLTKTATSSGSVNFILSEGGTWVVSGTVGGDTYSVEQYVEMEFEKTLEPLPNGSTATPVNVIQTWLKCAHIKDKNYTTLSQVLNDTATLEALVSDSNACDYMARSTNWASGIAADADAMALIGKFDYCANKLLSNATWVSAIANSTYFESVLNVKVPTMTSNTAPSGVASASTIYQSGYEAYKIFDGNNSTEWLSQGNPSGTTWVQYEFPNKVNVRKLKIRNAASASVIIRDNYNNLTVKGSNDGSTFTTIGTITFTQTTAGGEGTYNISNTQSYKCYRVEIPISPSVGQVGMSELQFYGRTDTMIPLVPKMTSNTTPSGEAGASTEYPSTYAYEAFDWDDSSDWASSQGTGGNEYIYYHFPTAKIVNGVKFKPFQDRVGTYKILGAHTQNINNAVELYSGSTTAYDTFDEAYFENTTPYEYYYFLIVTSRAANGYCGLRRLQFYEKVDLTENVLFRSAAQDDLYYLDNGSPVIIAHTDDYGYAVVDRDLLPKDVNLTVYSTVAKNPTSLGSPYSRVIHFSKYLTEVYMRPFNSLYWYGNKVNVKNTGNITPTWNTNSVSFSFTGGSNTNVYFRPSTTVTNATKTYIITTNPAAGNSGANLYVGTMYKSLSKTSNVFYDSVSGATGGEPYIYYGNNSISGDYWTGTLYALWYE